MGALNINSGLSLADRSDKRYFPRWQVKKLALCSFKKNTQTLEAMTVDLSCTGACLQTNVPIPLKTKIKTTIHLSKTKTVQLTGGVVWHKPSKDGHLYGIKFSKMNTSSENLLFCYAFNINRH